MKPITILYKLSSKISFNFQNKYLLSLLITSIVPLLVTLVLLVSITHTQLEAQQVVNLLEEAKMVSQNMNARIDVLSLASQNLTNFLVNQLTDFDYSSKQQSSITLAQYELLRDNISTMETLFSLDRIRIFSDEIPFIQNSNHLTLFPMHTFNMIAEDYPEILSKVSLNRLSYIIQRNTQIRTKEILFTGDIVTLYRPIYNINNELIAVQMIDCKASGFLDCASSLTEGCVAVSNANGEIICARGEDEEIESLMALNLETSSHMLKDHHVIACYSVPSLDWSLRISIPAATKINILQSFGSVYLTILLATTVFALGMGILISRLQAHRLQSYFNAVKNIDYTAPQSIASLPDRLDQKLAHTRYPDEIDHLMSSFSALVRDNLALIRNMKQHDLEIEKYKFKVLQEQINPHFLYNALETLRLSMMMDRKEDALQSLEALSRFYRIALSKGRDTIRIREELAMIQNYLAIENIGYKGTIRWHMDVDEDCLDMPIPKFLLQPLVENSILHSRAPSREDDLAIDIIIHRRNNDLHMIIQDNGAGIDPETLAFIQQGLDNNTVQKGKNGFGLSNVNRRLKLFYGNEYGLTLRSAPGCTQNIIILPIDILW